MFSTYLDGINVNASDKWRMHKNPQTKNCVMFSFENKRQKKFPVENWG